MVEELFFIWKQKPGTDATAHTANKLEWTPVAAYYTAATFLFW